MDSILDLLDEGHPPGEQLGKLRQAVRLLVSRIERDYSAVEQSEFVTLDELALQFRCTPETIREQVTKVLGRGVVHKIGNCLGLRRIHLIKFHEKLEMGVAA